MMVLIAFMTLMFYIARWVMGNDKVKRKEISNVLKRCKKDMKLNDVLRKWITGDNPYVSSITLIESDKTDFDCCAGGKRWFEGKKSFICTYKMSNVKWCKDAPFWTKHLSPESGHTITVFDNGVAKFTPFEGMSLKQRLLLVRMDSKSTIDFVSNFIHVIRYGCFCCAFFIDEEEGPKFVRYNRWSGVGSIDKFYYAK